MIELLLEAERAMSFGRLDRAEEIYQQVASADPRNSIAVVGIARVALERGDDLGAYLQARRALGIDPENEAARRLAVRLEEVLATRGEPVRDPLPRRVEPVAEPLLTHVEPAADPSPAMPERTPPSPAPGEDASPAAAPDGAHIPKARRRSLIDRLRRR